MKDFDKIHKLISNAVLEALSRSRTASEIAIIEDSEAGSLLFSKSIQDQDLIVRKIEQLGYLVDRSFAGGKNVLTVYL